MYAASFLQLFNEILTRGSYQSKVEEDLINHRSDLTKLAAAVAAFKPTDMQQVVDFVRNWQQLLLDQLYDERAVLKQIPDWPAVKWEAMWEAAVMYNQLSDLQDQCLAAAGAAATAAAAPGSSSSVAAVKAAEKVYSQVAAKLEVYQRQESGFEQKMKSQGIPWNGQRLVAAVKEASVDLGTCYLIAALTALEDFQQKLQQHQQQGLPSAGAKGSGIASTLWGCPVRDAKQQQRLQQQAAKQQQQLQQRRQQQLEDAVTFIFKLHQFAGGLDEDCKEAFCRLAAEVDVSSTAA